MVKIAFLLKRKRREREFSCPLAAREFIRLAVKKFGKDIQDFHPMPSPRALADSMEAVESGKGTDPMKNNGR